MSGLGRRLPVVLLVAVLFPVARPCAADDELARRLAALRGLVSPRAPAAAPPPPAAAGRCPDASWRRTEYGVKSRTHRAIRDASIRFGLDPELVRSVIRHESAYDVDAVSHKGAMGLMQLMPATARELGVVCAFDPRENVIGGARYLRQLKDRMGTWPRAIAAYHAGPARVDAGRIPAVTRRYVERVLFTWKGERGGAAWL